jgi:hypothetical protein
MSAFQTVEMVCQVVCCCDWFAVIPDGVSPRCANRKLFFDFEHELSPPYSISAFPPFAALLINPLWALILLTMLTAWLSLAAPGQITPPGIRSNGLFMGLALSACFLWYAFLAPMIRVVSPGVPNWLTNTVARCRISAEDADSVIDETNDYFSTRGVVAHWRLCPGDAPSELEERLIKKGLTQGEEQIAMAVDLQKLNEDITTPVKFPVQRVSSPAVMKEKHGWISPVGGGKVTRHPADRFVDYLRLR